MLFWACCFFNERVFFTFARREIFGFNPIIWAGLFLPGFAATNNFRAGWFSQPSAENSRFYRDTFVAEISLGPSIRSCRR